MLRDLAIFCPRQHLLCSSFVFQLFSVCDKISGIMIYVSPTICLTDHVFTCLFVIFFCSLWSNDSSYITAPSGDLGIFLILNFNSTNSTAVLFQGFMGHLVPERQGMYSKQNRTIGTSTVMCMTNPEEKVIMTS